MIPCDSFFQSCRVPRLWWLSLLVRQLSLTGLMLLLLPGFGLFSQSCYPSAVAKIAKNLADSFRSEVACG